MNEVTKLPDLKVILYHIAKGLSHKIYVQNKANNNKSKYPDSSVFRHGLNELAVFAMSNECFSPEGDLLAPLDETDAIMNYFSRPVYDWMSKWPQWIIDIAEKQYLLHWDNLVVIGDKHTYILSEFCEQLSDVHKINNVETELEQEDFYRRLISLEQKEYEFIRRFVIEKENRVIKKDRLNGIIRDVGVKYKKLDEIKQIFYTAYETWDNDGIKINICSRCGWTVSYDRNGYGKCQSDRCRNETNNFREVHEINDSSLNYYRLKRGIVRFVSDPGLIELDIERECKKLGLKVEMWPEMDKYDLKITFNDGKCWCVDAKDYSKAFLLKYKIENENMALPFGDWERGFIVIPNQRIKDDKDYCKIVNRGIEAIGQMRTSCVGVTDFINRVKERVVEF